MRDPAQYALSVGAASVLLSGCSGAIISPAQSGMAVLSPVNRESSDSQTLIPRIATERGYQSGSWVLPEAKDEDLFYVSEFASSSGSGAVVNIYKYPSGKLVGELTYFSNPGSMCADKFGNVFITDQHQVAEFPHGASSPSRVLSDSGGTANSCSVDPTTGDLAVGNPSSSSRPGQVLVYKAASGTPQIYSNGKLLPTVTSVAYDELGNLYADGARHGDGHMAFAQLPHHGHELHHFSLNVKFFLSEPPGDPLQWSGSLLAVTDTAGSTVSQFRVDGTAGTEVGSTSLSSGPFSQYLFQTWIQGNRILGTYKDCRSVHCSDGYAIWAYPSGGTDMDAWGGNAWGIVVSLRH